MWRTSPSETRCSAHFHHSRGRILDCAESFKMLTLFLNFHDRGQSQTWHAMTPTYLS